MWGFVVVGVKGGVGGVSCGWVRFWGGIGGDGGYVVGVAGVEYGLV